MTRPVKCVFADPGSKTNLSVSILAPSTSKIEPAHGDIHMRKLNHASLEFEHDFEYGHYTTAALGGGLTYTPVLDDVVGKHLGVPVFKRIVKWLKSIAHDLEPGFELLIKRNEIGA